MDDVTIAMRHLQVNQSLSQTSPLHLLSMPSEIRLKLYSFLFDVNIPIPVTVGMNQYLEQRVTDIYLFAIGAAKAEGIHQYIPLSTQLLRTCHQVYEEATLLKLSLGTRLCINKLQINLDLSQQPDYDSISKQLPSVPTLEVQVNGPGPALLLATYELSKVLVNSDILPNEPLLQLCARVPSTPAAFRQNEAALVGAACYQVSPSRSICSRFGEVMRSKSDFTLTKLDDYITRPLLGLGKQVTGFTVIRVHGELHPDYLKAIDQHECTFGDCSFEKVDNHESPKDSSKYVVYRWQKKHGEPAAIRGKDLSGAASLMRDFVPHLSQKFIEAMQEAGLDTSLLARGPAKQFDILRTTR